MLLLLLGVLASVPAGPTPTAGPDCWGGTWAATWGNAWGSSEVEPPVVVRDDEFIFYPGACYPFGGGGKIRPHRLRKTREAEHLMLLH